MTVKKQTSLVVRAYFASVFLMIVVLLTTPVFGQNSKDTVKPNLLSNGDDNQGDIFNQLREYSRPGTHHQLLEELVGTWTLKGEAFSADPDSNKVVFRFNSSAVRKPFANGRFFIVTITGDVVEMPIQNGKTKKVNAQEIITEGYDNVKNKFEQTSISNHIGSDILYSEGYYDSTKKTIAFIFEQELVPGIRDKVRELFILIDKDHYKLEYYQEKNDKYIKVTVISYTRVKK